MKSKCGVDRSGDGVPLGTTIATLVEDKRMTRIFLFVIALSLLAGCTDGVLYQMKRVNPYFQAEWKRDRELGTTFVERIEELQVLQSQLASMSPDDKLVWAPRLQRVIANDPSSEFRAKAVQTIALIPSDLTVQALNAASTDSSEKVRLTACKAWAQVGGPAARDMLLTLSSNPNETTSVRQAAIDSLSIFADDHEVHSAFSALLDDRSPAIQYQVTRSLAKATGNDLGGDLQSWRDFLDGKTGGVTKASFASGILKRRE